MVESFCYKLLNTAGFSDQDHFGVQVPPSLPISVYAEG